MVGASPDVVAEAAAAAAEARASAVRRDTVERAVARLDDAVLGSMLAALQSGDVLRDPRREHTTEQVLTACRVSDRHRPLVRRWLDELADAGRLGRKGECWSGAPPVLAGEAAAAWDDVERRWAAGDLGGLAFPRYLRQNAERLPELMTGELPAMALMFAGGRMDLATAVYRDNITTQVLGAAAAAAAAAIRPARVLEVGAGTGATTELVLDALDDDTDYLFTDVTPYFLRPAQERFGDRVRVALLDAADPDAAAREGPFDLIVAAGVLHALPDIDAGVVGLVAALAPGGWLALCEPVQEHLGILISHAFMMTPPRDARALRGRSFLTIAGWRDVFAGAGLDPVAMIPTVESPIAPLGQQLLLAHHRPG